MTLPLDNDGFLRRECPHCARQFKWHHGPANEEAEQQPDPTTYHCPFCGTPGEPDSWWTQEQLDYVQGVAAPAALRFAEEELGRALKRRRSSFLKVEMTGATDLPGEPVPLTEPDDMVIVASPCHSYEPVKLPVDAIGPFHCLICGERFAV